MKAFKIITFLLILTIAGGFAAYGVYAVYDKVQSVTTAVSAFLVEEGVEPNSFTVKPDIEQVLNEGFVSVSVQVEGDAKVYHYFLNEQHKIVLESIVEDGQEYLINNVMN